MDTRPPWCLATKGGLMDTGDFGLLLSVIELVIDKDLR